MTRDNEEFLNVQQDDVSRLAASVNNALFELVPDEAQSITQKRRITRWDNKHKRYVTGTVGELKENVHIRNESGQLIKSHSKVKRGELYAQWKKSHKVGEQAIGGGEKPDYRGGRRGCEKRGELRGRRNGKQKGGERAPRNELKTRDQVRKDLKEKEKNKVKQMNKKDREAYLKKSGKEKRGTFNRK